jgi:hypothetical protein
VRRSRFVAAGLLLFACHREPAESKPPVVIDARPATTVASPPDLRPAPQYDPQDPLTVPSLEISGEVQLPIDSAPPKQVFIYISSGDCLDQNAPLLRRTPVTESGTFLSHIVAQPGVELSLCAAGEFTPGSPTPLYGKLGKPIHVSAQREQEVRDVKISLTLGATRQFPAGKK